MNIVMFSMTPLFHDQSMGGAQKQLKKVALYLAEQGHHVTILCTRRSDAMQPFHWHDRLQVIPIYCFKQPFPEPYATDTYNIASAIQDTGEYLAKADVFYNHDGGLIFPYIHSNIPAVISLRSIIFSETLQSGYLFQGDALILPSDHTAQAWLHTVGRFFPDFKNRAHVIHNGLDFEVYRPTPPAEFAHKLGVDLQKHRYILYPHRPEASKGILHTIAVVDLLVHHYGLTDVRVLCPQWIDTGLSSDVRQFYDDLQADIDERRLRDYFIYHPWVSDSQMPEYLSLGSITFALGSYVETFGNVPYESLACGTPVIASRVAPYRDMLPPEVLVDYGDIEAIATRANDILSNRQRTSPAIMEWLYTHFQQENMVQAYAEIILNTKQKGMMTYHFQPITDETRFILAPWCYLSTKGIYHDFRATYSQDDTLINLIQNDPDGLSLRQHKSIMDWYREGYLIPLQGQLE